VCGWLAALIVVPGGIELDGFPCRCRAGWQARRDAGPPHAEANLDAYLPAATMRDETKSPLFRSVDNRRKPNPMTRTDVLRMVKGRALAAGLPLHVLPQFQGARHHGVPWRHDRERTSDHGARIAGGRRSSATGRATRSRSTKSNGSRSNSLPACVGSVLTLRYCVGTTLAGRTEPDLPSRFSRK
jgi:hypothetical protein